MPSVPTVKVKAENEAGYMVINKTDFNDKDFTLFEGKEENNDPPTDPEERQLAIIAAIIQLPKDDETLWMGNDAPTVKAIEDVLGYNISADERTTAWEALQAE